jgi:lipid-A-disaccharide synthase
MTKSKKNRSILIIAGEASGDMHGASLVKALRTKKPDLDIFGIGGDRMAEEGVEIIYHARDLSFLGFFEVIKHLPFIQKVFRNMIARLKTQNPDLVILIDYPGFNLRFAEKAKKLGFPVLYYISPQVWAWGRNRVKKMAKYIDQMIVIFPFETEFYRQHNMDVRFVGHPLKDRVDAILPKKDFLNQFHLDSTRPVIGLLPGSRIQEVQKLFGLMIQAYQKMKKKIPDLQAVVGLAPTLTDSVYTKIMKHADDIFLIRNHTYEVMAHSDAVMVASGTATLETALLGTPMVVLYKMTPLSFFIGRILVKIKNIAIVNIVAGKTVVPELIQNQATPEKIEKEMFDLLTNDKRRTTMKKQLSEVSQKLGEKGANNRAADVVLEFLEKHIS